jgi:hypothetical protein
LFLTTAPAQCLGVNEVVEVYYQRGGFEQVLSDDDAEQDPDRWCSCTPHGQEFWQILSQWVWNTRLELGLVAQEYGLRTTRWNDADATTKTTLTGPTEVGPTFDQSGEAPLIAQYGPLEVAQNWGRASGRFTGAAFAVLEDGMLRCPADKILRPQERRTEADGTLRIVYRARKEDCHSCAFASKCLGRQAAGVHPRRVSAVRKRVAEAGGTRAALVHEEAPMLDERGEPHEMVWRDLPGYRIRQEYVVRLRGQRVTIVELQAAGRRPVPPAAVRIWTRAERAHRRLSWATRLARNLCATAPSRYRLMVFGVAPALATYLGLAPPPSG